jgi:Holliday junction resolvase
MSGNGPRNKGARTECGVVKALQASGIAAVHVPLSGAAGGRFGGDVILPLMGRDLCVEVKARAAGFRELYSWLTGGDVLIVKADRQEPLVIVRLSLAAEIANWSLIMPRRPAQITQADVARIIRAAKLTGASEVVFDMSDSGRGDDARSLTA